MNFDFSDDLKQLREQARKFLRERCPPAAVRRILEGAGALRQGAVARDRRHGLDRRGDPRGVRRRRASAISACACWPRSWARRWRRCRSRPRSISPAEAIMPAAARRRRRPGCRSCASGEAIGTLALAEGPGKADVAQAAHDLPQRRAQRREAAGARRRRGRRCRGRWRRAIAASSLALVDLKASGVTRAAVETIDPSRSHARIAFDGAPAEPLGAPRRRRAPAAARAGPRRRAVRLRAGRRRAAVARDGARLCARALRLRPADRLVPGDQAQAGRHLCRDRAGPLQRLLRRLGARARRAGAAARGGRGPRSRPTRPSSWPPRRTSRCTAAWASPGSSTATSTIAAPSCSRWRSAARRLWKDRLVTQLETANAPL